MKFKPLSSACRMMRMASCSDSDGFPICEPPKPRQDTFSPVRPSVLYSTLVLAASAPLPVKASEERPAASISRRLGSSVTVSSLACRRPVFLDGRCIASVIYGPGGPVRSLVLRVHQLSALLHLERGKRHIRRTKITERHHMARLLALVGVAEVIRDAYRYVVYGFHTCWTAACAGRSPV